MIPPAMGSVHIARLDTNELSMGWQTQPATNHCFVKSIHLKRPLQSVFEQRQQLSFTAQWWQEFFILCVLVFCMNTCLCSMHVFGAHRSQKPVYSFNYLTISWLEFFFVYCKSLHSPLRIFSQQCMLQSEYLWTYKVLYGSAIPR